MSSPRPESASRLLRGLPESMLEMVSNEMSKLTIVDQAIQAVEAGGGTSTDRLVYFDLFGDRKSVV